MKDNLKKWLFLLIPLTVAISITACSSDLPPKTTEHKSAYESAPSQPKFTDKKWIVKHSNSIATGQTYEFLSNGVLVINAPQQKQALGHWSYKDKKLVMIEESISYPVDILVLTDKTFKIKMHNPGEPVEIELSVINNP